MTWAALRKLYLQATGDNVSAQEEAWTHLTEGYRVVSLNQAVDVPELAAIDESVTVAIGADYIEMSTVDFSAFAILSVFNKTDGFQVLPEPGGMVGRMRYLDTTGKPPSGTVSFYQRDGTKLYVRDIPSATTTLMVRVRRQIAALTEADVNGSPLTPAQFDYPILYQAVAGYFSIHPATDGGDPAVALDVKYRDLANQKILEAHNPRVEEDRPHRGTMRLRGYSITPRSRLG